MTPKLLSTTTSDKKRRVLEETFEFMWDAGGKERPCRRMIEVPEGYTYEVFGPHASQILLIVAGPYYAGEDASLGHDWAYRHQGNIPSWELNEEKGQWLQVGRPLTKLEIDEMMRLDPEDPWRVQLLTYWGVRLFGWWKWQSWDTWTKETLSGALKSLIPSWD